MKRILNLIPIILISTSVHAQWSSGVDPMTTSQNIQILGHLHLHGPSYSRNDHYTLNKTANNWVPWAMRNTTTPETTVDLMNIGNLTLVGNVGIGTPSPSARLQVVSPALGANDATLRLGPIGGSSSASSQFSLIDFHSTFDNYPADQGARRTASIKAGFSGGVWGNEYMAFHLGNNGNANDFGHLPIERMRISGNGNIGIGTPAPQELLHLKQDNVGIKLSSNTYYGGSGQSNGQVIGKVKFNNYNAGNPGLDYSSEIRGILTDGWATSVGLDFLTWGASRMRIIANGNVGIGITNPTAKLEVDGTIISEEIKVQVVSGPDYVFSPDYELRTLEETKTYIEENQHLPEIPSAAEMEANGVALGEMNMLLLKKIEELTLYILEQEERIQKLENHNQN